MRIDGITGGVSDRIKGFVTSGRRLGGVEFYCAAGAAPAAQPQSKRPEPANETCRPGFSPLGLSK
eukprot:5701207-Prymnesium_polylepis.1